VQVAVPGESLELDTEAMRSRFFAVVEKGANELYLLDKFK
jgi:hypothetical protein